jgi:hypothetical protein
VHVCSPSSPAVEHTTPPPLVNRRIVGSYGIDGEKWIPLQGEREHEARMVEGIWLRRNSDNVARVHGYCAVGAR